jgi:hypothetical protein
VSSSGPSCCTPPPSVLPTLPTLPAPKSRVGKPCGRCRHPSRHALLLNRARVEEIRTSKTPLQAAFPEKSHLALVHTKGGGAWQCLESYPRVFAAQPHFLQDRLTIIILPDLRGKNMCREASFRAATAHYGTTEGPPPFAACLCLKPYLWLICQIPPTYNLEPRSMTLNMRL